MDMSYLYIFPDIYIKPRSEEITETIFYECKVYTFVEFWQDHKLYGKLADNSEHCWEFRYTTKTKKSVGYSRPFP